jgi:ABC-2 type transport system permease protein
MSALLEETRCEFRKLYRDPAFVLPSLGFPTAFFLLFGVMLPYAKTDAARWVAIANYSAFAVLGACLFAASLSLAKERETGVYAHKRSSPLSMHSFLLAKAFAAAAFSAVAALVLLLVGCLCYGFWPDASALISFLSIALVCGFCLSSLGLWVGSIFQSNAAAVVVNLIFMPMAFLGGLAMPLSIMPSWVQQGAQALASFHSGELLRAALSPQISMQRSTLFDALLVLVGTGAIFAILSARSLARSRD